MTTPRRNMSASAAALLMLAVMWGPTMGTPGTRLLTTASAHGLTIQDIGSVWMDSAGTPLRWVLMDIPSTTTIRFGREPVIKTDTS